MILRLATALLCLLFLAPLIEAQSDDSRNRVEQPGIAFVQDFPSSPPRPRRFTAYQDQTAIGYGDRGFYHFRFEKASRDTKVSASQVKTILLKPVLPDTIITAADRDVLVRMINQYEKAAKAFPSSSTAIMELVEPFSEAVSSFDSGNIRVDGNWVNRVDYLDSQVERYDKQLRAEMGAAPSKTQFDYKRNPFYLEIKALAPTDPYIAERLARIDGDFSSLIARESLEKMLGNLENADLPAQQTKEILDSLAEVKDPTPNVSRILDQSKTAGELTTSTQTLRRSFNAAFSASPATLPELPADLASETGDLVSRMRQFMAGRPPAAMQIPDSQVRNMLSVAEKIPVLRSMLDAKDYTAAAELSSKLATSADAIGTPVKTVFTNIHSHCNAQLERVAALRAEAEELVKSGKKKEAAEKLSEAIEIMPNQEAEQQLSDLNAK